MSERSTWKVENRENKEEKQDHFLTAMRKRIEWHTFADLKIHRDHFSAFWRRERQVACINATFFKKETKGKKAGRGTWWNMYGATIDFAPCRGAQTFGQEWMPIPVGRVSRCVWREPKLPAPSSCTLRTSHPSPVPRRSVPGLFVCLGVMFWGARERREEENERDRLGLRYYWWSFPHTPSRLLGWLSPGRRSSPRALEKNPAIFPPHFSFVLLFFSRRKRKWNGRPRFEGWGTRDQRWGTRDQRWGTRDEAW